MSQYMHICRYPLAALAAVTLLWASVLVFEGWMAHGAEIFLTYAETGLSWCL